MKHSTTWNSSEISEIPSGKLTWLAGISPFLIGNTSSKGPFSIAMLVYRSVSRKILGIEQKRINFEEETTTKKTPCQKSMI